MEERHEEGAGSVEMDAGAIAQCGSAAEAEASAAPAAAQPPSQEPADNGNGARRIAVPGRAVFFRLMTLGAAQMRDGRKKLLMDGVELPSETPLRIVLDLEQARELGQTTLQILEMVEGGAAQAPAIAQPTAPRLILP